MPKAITKGKENQKEKTKEKSGTTAAVAKSATPAIATTCQTQSAAVSKPTSTENTRYQQPSPQKNPSKKTKKKRDHQQDEEDGIPEEGLTAERACELLHKLDEMKAQMAAEVATHEAAEEQVKNVCKRKAETQKIIPKPKGTCGRDYKLREAMGWGSKANEDPMKKCRYLDCLAVVCDLVIVGQLNWRKGIREQDAATLGAVFAAAHEEVPCLARFEDDWATAQIIIQFFMNCRHHLVKKRRAVISEDAQGRHALKLRKILGKVIPATTQSGGNSELSNPSGSNDEQQQEDGRGVMGGMYFDGVDGLGQEEVVGVQNSHKSALAQFEGDSNSGSNKDRDDENEDEDADKGGMDKQDSSDEEESDDNKVEYEDLCAHKKHRQTGPDDE
ncbi:hypothetical protein C8Q74DRAFT_1222731 [Fomes fomentarius]|nr:hypothetical protein C8Q74DRAFT_1222731 [Fomes fomentarius]